MRAALRLAARGFGHTSPNPMVGAILVKGGVVLGQGFHRQAGQPHAEVEALSAATGQGHRTRGATLYVTLEPCCTHGRTPPCTDAILAAGIKRVVVAATDPNPSHAGRAFDLLRRAGIDVVDGILAHEASRLNETFNHWITRRTPFVTVKAAMSLDGKIATRTGDSKWITTERSRAHAMRLRQASDAILVGIRTVLADDPSLTVRTVAGRHIRPGTVRQPRRIVLDSDARIPRTAALVSDEFAHLTTVVVSKQAPAARVAALRKRIQVVVAPTRQGTLDVRWLLKKLGGENVTSLLVEGGGEVNASFLLGRRAQRVAFFYAPKIIGGRDARKGVAGAGIERLTDAIRLREIEYRWLGGDLFLTARTENEVES